MIGCGHVGGRGQCHLCVDDDVSCQRLCSLAQSTKQEMEDGASLRKSEEAEPASSEEDSGLDVKVCNTTEEENKDKTPASGQFFRR